MFSKKSIFSGEDLTMAIKLAKRISWFIKQREQLGPFPSGDDWYVSNGICHTCGGLTDGNVYKNRNEAVEAAQDIVAKRAMDDIENLQEYGPIGGLCNDCKEKYRYAKQVEEESCSFCGRDCGHCSIFGMLDDLFN